MNIVVKKRRIGALAVAVLVTGCSSMGSGSPAHVLPQTGTHVPMTTPKSVSPALTTAPVLSQELRSP